MAQLSTFDMPLPSPASTADWRLACALSGHARNYRLPGLALASDREEAWLISTFSSATLSEVIVGHHRARSLAFPGSASHCEVRVGDDELNVGRENAKPLFCPFLYFRPAPRQRVAAIAPILEKYEDQLLAEVGKSLGTVLTLPLAIGPRAAHDHPGDLLMSGMIFPVHHPRF